MSDPFTQAEQEAWEALKPFMSREQFLVISDQAKAFALAEVDRHRESN